jgi:hypothetical protein
VDFIRIVIVFFKYIVNFISLTPRKHDFSHILQYCLLYIAESREYHPVFVLLHNHKWRKNISTKFHEILKQWVYFIFDIVSLDISSNCRRFNGSPLLCPINATSSFSYVFRLQYPRGKSTFLLYSLRSPEGKTFSFYIRYINYTYNV